MLLSQRGSNKSISRRDSLRRAYSEQIVRRSIREQEDGEGVPAEVEIQIDHDDSHALVVRSSANGSGAEEKEDKRKDMRKAFSERLTSDVISTDNRGSQFSRHRRSGSEDLQKSGALALMMRRSTRADDGKSRGATRRHDLRKSKSELFRKKDSHEFAPTSDTRHEKKIRKFEGLGKLSLHGLGERGRLGGFFRSQSEKFFRKQMESERRGSGMGSQPGRTLKKRSGSGMKHSSTDPLPDGIPEFISFDSSECAPPSPYKSQDDNDELRALNERLAKLKLPMPEYRQSDHRRHFEKSLPTPTWASQHSRSTPMNNERKETALTLYKRDQGKEEPMKDTKRLVATAFPVSCARTCATSSRAVDMHP